MIKILVKFDYGTSNLWKVDNKDNITESIEVEELEIDDFFKEKLKEMNEQYMALFINNSMEFYFNGFDNLDDAEKYWNKWLNIIENLNSYQKKYKFEIDEKFEILLPEKLQ